MYGGSGTWPSASTSVVDVARRLGPEPDRPAAVEVALEHLGHQHAGVALEPHERARLQLLPGVHQGLCHTRLGSADPAIRAIEPARVRRRAQQQALDGAAARHAAAEQPRGEHARVVDDEQIARAQQRREIADGAVPARAGDAVEHQEPRGAARRGLLRDQLVRKVEVEIAKRSWNNSRLANRSLSVYNRDRRYLMSEEEPRARPAVERCRGGSPPSSQAKHPRRSSSGRP